MSTEVPKSPDLVLPERHAPALVASLILHVILLTSIGLVFSQSPGGTEQELDRPVGIALVHQLPDRDRYVEATAVEQTIAETSESQSSASLSSASLSTAAPPADLAPPLDLSGILQSMQATPAHVSGSGLAGEMKLDGDAFGSDRGTGKVSDALQTTAVLFGVSGSGSRFVYVFDRSDSMNGFGGKPLRAAKSELIRSLKTMSQRQRFQIIFYNDKPTPFRVGGMPLQMVAGEPGYVDLAESYIRSVAAFGGTEHESALKMALRMSPDVIFFLTDASIPRLSALQLRKIKNRADGVGATIHCIEFGANATGSPNSFLRDLAAQNRGQYKYVNVRSLGQQRPQPNDKSKDAP